MEYCVIKEFSKESKVVEADSPQMALRIYLGLSPLDMAVTKQKIVKQKFGAQYVVFAKNATKKVYNYYRVIKED